ncbi:MAG: hypothetical protein H0W72_12855 [Planctomycetes bacterium]|nr:hypothetical protein [Planctomycetota bacterium]
MRLLAIGIIALLTCALQAAETAPAIARLASGDGTVAGQPASAQATIAAGQLVVAGAKPIRLELADFARGAIVVAPGGSLSFVVEKVEDGKRRLAIQLAAGAIQVDVTGTGRYAQLTVRGAALEMRVTGTLFVVERLHNDTDYVALVKGRLLVGLRKEIAEELGDSDSVQLTAHQGLAGDVANGLAAVDQLNHRPQILNKSGAPMPPAQEQGTAPAGEGDGGWDTDAAAAATADAAVVVAPPAPETPAPPADAPPLAPVVIADPPPAPVENAADTEVAKAELFSDLAADLGGALLDGVGGVSGLAGEVNGMAASSRMLAGPPNTP